MFCDCDAIDARELLELLGGTRFADVRPELPERADLDLADALARDAEQLDDGGEEGAGEEVLDEEGGGAGDRRAEDPGGFDVFDVCLMCV